ncbi:hypothetical protein DLJ53_05835 [Acuticoccus sediminis]|uniref:Uncharacterized protein n=1 Tax=Acuticoccus sediminis TaxID=2184697 RepID=A0A8B2NX89_9HYPH|nr:hypothetical protein [Acuticoccus sediminis]RAI03983.1 hypothetical protein DLJ53_05835 [Acuticoccus sediminis]
MLKAPLFVAAMLVIGSGAIVSGVHAEENPSLDISGKWKGKGFVQKDDKSRKMNVTCQIEGEQNGNDIGFDGECRAMMVLKRAIGADIQREGVRYRGTYVGSNAGPAELDGGPQDDGRIVLTMTFPKTIHGDDIATMTIEPANDSMFKITTVDTMDDGQTKVTTAEITFERN